MRLCVSVHWGKLGMSLTERFAQETVEAFKMAEEAQRLYHAAYREAQHDNGACGANAPWQYRMDVAERMQRDADDMTNDVEARAIAAGVDVTDMLNLTLAS